MKKLLGWALILCASAGAQDTFEHSSHDGYFPLCTSCHAGIESGGDPYPAVTFCQGCHDDERMPTVDWEGPTARVSRLRFEHQAHFEIAEAVGEEVECSSCHDPDAEEFRLDVQPLKAETCLQCHGEQRGHFDQEGRCQLCHVPLEEYKGDWDGASMPQPSSHLAEDFLSRGGHALQAEHFRTDCTVCHARESCERCHRNGDKLGSVQQMAPDPRVAAWLSGKLALYPVPADHDATWLAQHGGAAEASTASCSNCHAKESCSDCHREGNAAAVVAQLPSLRPQEIDPTIARRLGYHAPGFANAHAHAVVVAARAGESCLSCHVQSTCEDCHGGEVASGFHGANFVERHGAQLYGGVTECGSCHSTETFCRDCHSTMLAGNSDLGSAFHDRSPLWILQHGEAARFTLESCASCHQQSDCLRCHSQVSGWGVNPHGQDFDADAMADANLGTCRACHWEDPR